VRLDMKLVVIAHQEHFLLRGHRRVHSAFLAVIAQTM
jgi:hypothetical protein